MCRGGVGDFLIVFVESNVYVMSSLMHMYKEFDGFMGLKNVVPWTTMVGAYAKIGSMNEARRLFDEIPERNVVSWTSLVTGYARIGRDEEAVGFFKKMVRANIKPDIVVMVPVLFACAQLGDLDLGKWIHQFVNRELGRTRILDVALALIDMYEKCGDVDAVRPFPPESRVFDSKDQKIPVAWNAIIDGNGKLGNRMPKKDVLAWTAIITGLAIHGDGKSSLDHFYVMLEEKIRPNEVTSIGVLSACSQSGLVEEGYLHFKR
ncbi:hypothetical protein HHK36_020555 [Tetracentron sinense]|uniref:Pentatricopeptide repeat-containing protein n=1 Tax=Tetracentron sinense TaxID=13715 RepID=A0A834YU51_TETSI|nr:hypothetical protein HHK36_020555 [Tetracentron sinense]